MPDRTVLVVEDFDDTRAFIRMLLEMKGCRVLEAVNGREAVEAAAAHCERHTSARVLVARAPRMWTHSTNTPLGRFGAVPTEQVAAGIVRWVASGDDGRRGFLTGEDLADAALERPSA